MKPDQIKHLSWEEFSGLFCENNMARKPPPPSTDVHTGWEEWTPASLAERLNRNWEAAIPGDPLLYRPRDYGWLLVQRRSCVSIYPCAPGKPPATVMVEMLACFPESSPLGFIRADEVPGAHGFRTGAGAERRAAARKAIREYW